VFFYACGKNKSGAGWERRKIKTGKPRDGFEEMGWNGSIVEELGDGFTSERRLRNGAEDDADAGSFAKGNNDEMT